MLLDEAVGSMVRLSGKYPCGEGCHRHGWRV